MKEWEEKLVAYCEETVADFALLRKAAKQLKDDIFKALHIKQLCKWLESKLTKYKENDVSKKDKLYMESLRHKIRNIEQDKEWTFKAWNRQVNEMLADMKAKDDAIDKLRAEIAKLKAEKKIVETTYGSYAQGRAVFGPVDRDKTEFDRIQELIDGLKEIDEKERDRADYKRIIWLLTKHINNREITVLCESISNEIRRLQ